jgi:hypothetical protein
MVPEGWRYDPSMTGRVSVDWGRRKPAALVLVHDDELDADIVVADLLPRDTTTQELAAQVLSVAWPRRLASSAPGPRWLLDLGTCDRSGHNENDQTGHANVKIFAADPSDGGIGMRLRSTSDPVKLDRANRIRVTQERLCGRDGARRLLFHPRMWARRDLPVSAGLRDLLVCGPEGWVVAPGKGSGTSLRTQLGRYRTVGDAEIPRVKSEDPFDAIDALEYDTAVLFTRGGARAKG